MAGEEKEIKNLDTDEVINFSEDEGYNMGVFSVDFPDPDENDDPDKKDTGDKNEKTDENGQIISDPKTDTSAKDDDEDEGEKVTNEDDDDKKKSGEGEDKTSPNIYSSLADVLREQGIITSLDPEKNKIESVDDFIDAFNSELKAREYANLNERQKSYLAALEKGIPDDEIREHLKVSDELSKITEDELSENAELRFEIIKQDFIASGMSEERASKLAKRSQDIGEDLEDSVLALTSLQDKEKQNFENQLKQREEAAKAQRQKMEEDLKNLKKEISSKNEIISGLQISENQKNKLYEIMTKPVAMKGNTPISAIHKARMEDPMDFEVKVNYLFMITNGFKDFNKLVKSSKSKAVKDLEAAIKNGNQNSLGASGNVSEEITDEETKQFQDIIQNNDLI